MEIVTQYLDIDSSLNNNQTIKIRYSFIDFYEQSGFENGEFEIEFSKNLLYKAAVTVGKGNADDIIRSKCYSLHEINFRIEMINAFLNLEGEYVKRSVAFYLLDPSEKGAINYFLGMIFSNLIASLKLDVTWLIHLDSYDKSQIEFTRENRKKPDFIGITSNDERIVVESKGWMVRKSGGISNAIKQLNAVLNVEGEHNVLKVASVLYEKNEELHIDVVDPLKEGFIKIYAGDSDYLKDYYSRVFMLLQDSTELKEFDNCIFVCSKLNCGVLEVGLLQEVYNIMMQVYININKHEEKVTKKIREVIHNREYELRDIDKKHNLSVGLDGIYIKRIG